LVGGWVGGGWRREREGSGWRERRGRPKEDSRVSERKLESVVKYKRRLPRRSNQPLRREQITVQTTFSLDPREERERGEKGGDASAVSTRVAATRPLLAARSFFFHSLAPGSNTSGYIFWGRRRIFFPHLHQKDSQPKSTKLEAERTPLSGRLPFSPFNRQHRNLSSFNRDRLSVILPRAHPT